MKNGLMNRIEAADYLGVSPATLAAWQVNGKKKVPHLKLGKRVRYRAADLDRFIESEIVNPVGAE